METINSKNTVGFIFHPSFYVESGIRDEKVWSGAKLRDLKCSDLG
jgi:hypothetical protein